jgi:hypothetical protein
VPQPNPGPPSIGYLEHLVAGAAEAGLPPEYIHGLHTFLRHREA